MKKDNIEKAEFPFNALGLGYNSTLTSAPFLFTEVDFTGPHDNFRYQYCGACPFYRSDGSCVALSREVHILGSCKLYLSMEQELTLRHEAFINKLAHEHDNPDGVSEDERAYRAEDLEVREKIEKYIVERDGKYCIISHTTGKNLGCYDTKEKAQAALDRMKRFRKELIVKIASTDEEQRIVVGIVMEPDEVDAHEHTVTASEIEKAAHRYALTPMVVGSGHIEEAEARPVETYIYNPEILKDVKPGSWLMAVKVHDEELWKMVKNGEMTGFSIGAMARLVPAPDEDLD